MQAIAYAILAALLYGISTPISKLLLKEIPPTLIAALLYLGAGMGVLLLDIVAPILLMIGLTKTTAANASLLNNFKIVATAVIALFIFKETIGKRLKKT